MVGSGAKKGGREREKMRGLAKIIEALCFLVEMRRKNSKCELRKEGKVYIHSVSEFSI